MAEPDAPRQEVDPIIFPSSMTGSKPKVTTTASEQKKTRVAEAEARKRKNTEASDAAPSKKKRRTKKNRAAPTEPLFVEPISVIHPASASQELHMTVHEPASTEAHEAEEIPVVDPITAEDIGHHDNVEDDEVLPQIEHQLVSLPVLMHSELISIGRPQTPTSQDASWADHPQRQDTPISPQPQVTSPVQDDDDFEAQQLHLRNRRQHYAGFAKDQGLKSLFRAFQKEKCTINLLHVKCFQKPLQL